MSTMEQERNMSDNVESQQEESSSMSADESQPPQKPSRQRKQRRGGSRQPRQQQQQSGPLDSLPTGDLTQTAQGAAGGVTNTLGSVANGALSKGGDEGGKDTLRLRLDLNLEIEIQLKARIHGDLELALLN